MTDMGIEDLVLLSKGWFTILTQGLALHCGICENSSCERKFIISRVNAMQGNARIGSKSISTLHCVATSVDAWMT